MKITKQNHDRNIKGANMFKYLTFILSLLVLQPAFAQNAVAPCVTTTGIFGSSCSPVTATNGLPVTLTAGGGLSSNIAQWGGVNTSLGSKVSASSVPVVIASDDNVNTVAAQAVRATGTITANAQTVTTTVSQYSVATVTVTGTYTGLTLAIEASDDAGVTYYPVLASDSSSTASAASSISPGTNASKMYNVTLPGVTTFRVRSTAFASGTANIGITATADPMVFNVAAGIVGIPTIQGNAASLASDSGLPVKTGYVFNTTQPTATTGQRIDSQGTSRGAAIVATGVDAFNVSLQAGTNLIGKFGIDQTTPGTTNAVSISQINGTTTPTVTGGAMKVGIADSTGTAITWGQQTMANSLPVTVASNQAAFSVNAAPIVGTTGGTTKWFNSGSLTNTVVQVQSGATNVYDYMVGNSSTSWCYLEFWNALSANVTIGTTTPNWIISVPPGGAANLSFHMPHTHGTGFSVAQVSSAGGSGACASAVPVVSIAYN